MQGSFRVFFIYEGIIHCGTMLKPSLPTLPVVDINIEYYISSDIDETVDGPLAGLCSELEKMVGQNVVETINLDIIVWSSYNRTRWGELDDILGSPEGWPALKEVDILFNVVTLSHFFCKISSPVFFQV